MQWIRLIFLRSLTFHFAFKAGELSALYEGWNIVKYNENVGELHRVDAQGQRIKQHFATLLAQKVLSLKL